MQFKIGKPTLLCGNYTDIKNKMHGLSISLQKPHNKILFIDTLNSINIHHSVYKNINQVKFFKNIYCVRTDKPYDLFARLNTSENFIKLKGIGALLINNLNIMFQDSEEEEIIPLLGHITNKISYLTEKYKLVTVIGICSCDDEKAMRASKILLTKENLTLER